MPAVLPPPTFTLVFQTLPRSCAPCERGRIHLARSCWSPRRLAAPDFSASDWPCRRCRRASCRSRRRRTGWRLRVDVGVVLEQRSTPAASSAKSLNSAITGSPIFPAPVEPTRQSARLRVLRQREPEHRVSAGRRSAAAQQRAVDVVAHRRSCCRVTVCAGRSCRPCMRYPGLRCVLPRPFRSVLSESEPGGP